MRTTSRRNLFLLLLCALVCLATTVQANYRTQYYTNNNNENGADASITPQWADTTPVLLNKAYQTLADFSISNYLMQSVVHLHQAYRQSDQVVRNPLVPHSIVDAAERITHTFALHEDEASPSTMQQQQQQVEAETTIIPTMRATIPKNPCDSSSLYVTYNSTVFLCNNTRVTEQEYNRLKNNTALNCTAPIVAQYACICPLDRTGTNCNRWRTLTCKFALASPLRQCEKPNIKLAGLELEGDWPCLRFSMKDTITFQFLMNCSFTEAPSFDTINKDVPRNTTFTLLSSKTPVTGLSWNALQAMFTYFVNSDPTSANPSFARRAPIASNIDFTVYNFFSLSDTSGVQSYRANVSNQYIGREFVPFTLRFAGLSEQMFAGDRLYIEMGYFSLAELTSAQFERMFIDFTDRQAPPYVDNTNLILAVTLPIASVLVLVVLSIVGIIYCVKRNNANKQE